MHAARRGTLLFLLLALAAPSAGGAADAADPLEEVRRRLRAEAGLCEAPAPAGEDLPLVPITVLPGDTHARLAVELTGGRDAERVLRRIEPRLAPGARIHVPRALLTPALADPRLAPLTLGEPFPTLWRLAADGTTASGAAEVAPLVRNLQRLNAVVDPRRLHRGAAIQVPWNLHAAKSRPAVPALEIVRTHRVADVSGLDRRPDAGEFPAALRRRLQRTGAWERQLAPREVDLVVLHTTEHRGAPFANVLKFLQRKRLANYAVGPDGTAYEIVPEAYRAFGCGQSLWEGRYGVDLEAVNIEIYADTAGQGSGIAPAQYEGLRRLLGWLQARHPALHDGRIVTHRMVAVSYAYGTRSRKGDPYAFDWARAGLPDNSRVIDQDVLLGRAKPCADERYADRVTSGQTAAARFLHNL